MALTLQKTKVATRVAVDFPTMPRVPQLTITKDNESLQRYQSEMDTWYQGLRATVIDKLQALQSQIDSLKG